QGKVEVVGEHVDLLSGFSYLVIPGLPAIFAGRTRNPVPDSSTKRKLDSGFHRDGAAMAPE
ncbi:MAG: hypothetical protein ACREPY_17915, partial [Rhodanobacteraceae bacterium]